MPWRCQPLQINYRHFPHPVLSHFSDDVINCAFQTTIRPTATQTTYQFSTIAKTSNQDILRLIEEQKACYTYHIECPSSRYRTVVKSFEEQTNFEIPSDYLDGKVSVCSLIIATTELHSYKNRNFHTDYGETTFKIKKGDILAVASDVVFFADKHIDPLKRIPSIFTVMVDNNPEAPPLDIDFVGNKVVIKLSKENFQSYKILSTNQNLQPTVASLVVLPALISLIEVIKGEVDIEYEERRWYRVLTNKLKDIGIDPQNSNSFVDSNIVIAQKLIGDPLSNALQALEQYETEDEVLI